MMSPDDMMKSFYKEVEVSGNADCFYFMASRREVVFFESLVFYKTHFKTEEDLESKYN